MTDQFPTTPNATFLDGQNAACVCQFAAARHAHLGEVVMTATVK